MESLLHTRHPARALRHPLFWGALALLLLNDHVLKGAGVLPGALTGKLSDFAGLLVAPSLLAAMLRVSTRRGMALAHVAVGLVFAGIQVSAGIADAWSAAMGAVGFPWVITRDLSDLVALPMVGVSFVVFDAVARRRHVSTRRAVELVGASVGMTACLATSPPPELEEFYPSFNARAYINNGSDQVVNVLVRPLADGARLDCFEVATDPGFFLRESLFGTGDLWELPERTNIPLDDPTQERPECTAFHISGDQIRPFVVFLNGPGEELWVEGQTFEGTTETPGGVVLVFDDAGEFIGHRSTGETIDYAIKDAAPEGEACEPLSDGDRVDWSTVAFGDWVIDGIDVGVDGCHRFELSAVSGGAEHQWYLCVPETLQPFSAGQDVRIEGAFDGSPTVEVTHQASEGVLSLTVSRTLKPIGEVTAGARASFGCALQVDDNCGVVATPAELAVRIGAGEATAVSAGATLSGVTGLGTVDYHVAYAALRHTGLDECSPGVTDFGTDVEIVVVQRPL